MQKASDWMARGWRGSILKLKGSPEMSVGTQGLRRLAILLGIVGTFGGTWVAGHRLESVLEHSRFERLSKSEPVRQAAKELLADLEYEHQQFLAVQQAKPPIRPLSVDRYAIAEIEIQNAQFRIDLDAAHDKLDEAARKHSTLNRGGIKEVRWNLHPFKNAYDVTSPMPFTEMPRVESLILEDGRAHVATPAPTVWERISIAVLPLLGFFVPWAATLSIGWVVAGFQKVDPAH